MKLNWVLAVALLLSVATTAAAQTGAKNLPAEYKAGQVWNYRTATGAEESRIVILDVDAQSKKSKLVHIRIENLPVPSCGGVHLTTAIEHLAVPEKLLQKSTTDLLKDGTELPNVYFEAYKQWQKRRHKEIVSRPLAEVAFPPMTGPMICNFRQTV